ncbi:hypothetical protein BDZ97DRAFT_492024 [Flammula alnicola]|nr:hypothetical protein BDZ97DRAFT_492024 [Flammula alnicola]
MYSTSHSWGPGHHHSSQHVQRRHSHTCNTSHLMVAPLSALRALLAASVMSAFTGLARFRVRCQGCRCARHWAVDVVVPAASWCPRHCTRSCVITGPSSSMHSPLRHRCCTCNCGIMGSSLMHPQLRRHRRCTRHCGVIVSLMHPWRRQRSVAGP